MNCSWQNFLIDSQCSCVSFALCQLKYNAAECFCGVLSLVPALFTLTDVCLVFKWLCELHKCVIFQLGDVWLQFSSVCVSCVRIGQWKQKAKENFCVQVEIIHDDKVSLDVVDFLCMSAEPQSCPLILFTPLLTHYWSLTKATTVVSITAAKTNQVIQEMIACWNF